MFALWIGCVLLLHFSLHSIHCRGFTYFKNLQEVHLLEMTAQHVRELIADIDAVIVQSDRVLHKIPVLRMIPKNISLPLEYTPAVRTIRVKERDRIAFKLKMKTLMQESKFGYSYAAIVGITDAIINKEDYHLSILIDAFGLTVLRMSNKGRLAVLGDFIEKKVKLIKYWAKLLPMKTIRAIAQEAQLTMKNKKMLSDDIVKIFVTYDSFFTKNNGEQLLDKIAELYYKNYEASRVELAAVEGLIESIIDELITPIYNKRNTIQHTALISTLYEAYFNRFPDRRRQKLTL